MAALKVGDFIKTIPEIQAIDLTNKQQLADTIAYYKKASRYHSGSISSSITSSILPAVTATMDSPLTQDDLTQSALPSKITQYIYRKILGKFKTSGFAAQIFGNKNALQKALSLWWAFSSRHVVNSVRDQVVSEARARNFKEVVGGAYNNLNAVQAVVNAKTESDNNHARLSHLMQNTL